MNNKIDNIFNKVERIGHDVINFIFIIIFFSFIFFSKSIIEFLFIFILLLLLICNFIKNKVKFTKLKNILLTISFILFIIELIMLLVNKIK